jgi:tripartite-type tricarboxylate transporter receptor subunit TctC
MNNNSQFAWRRAAQGAWLLTCALTMAASGLQAQDYPTREIRLVNGYAAGAGADVASRIFAKHLEETLGKPVIVENKPGAFTNIGAAAVARAEPDGYTLMFSGHTAIATNIHLFKTLPFDPVKDFVAVAPAGNIGFGFAVGPQSSITSMAQLTAFLKAKGDKATYGYANAFALTATELYKNIAGVSPLAVPYKSAGDALNDLLRGEIDLIVYDLGVLTQQEASGRLRVLAVTTAERSTLRPDLPGMREAGVPDYDLGAWFGIWAPANTPRPIVDRLARAISEIWNKEDKRRGLTAQTIEPFVASPDEFAQFVKKETAKWGRVIEIAKIEKQ